MRTFTVTIIMINAMLVIATPIANRKIVYEFRVVTHYVYPDGSPATYDF